MLITGDVAEMVLAVTRLLRNAVVPNIVISRAGDRSGGAWARYRAATEPGRSGIEDDAESSRAISGFGSTIELRIADAPRETALSSVAMK